jgi:NAD(P)-dependent dehydrogenase (short-subunit alcohol dehydrogenase family)
MVQHGATRVVLLSRGGGISTRVKQLIDEAKVMGAVINVKACDVADAGQVQTLIKTGLAGYPPLKGVVHAAMVLHVS